MYIFDFFKQVTRKGNIPVFIYLLINVLLIAVFSQNTFKGAWFQAFIIAIVIYFISLVIALSPLGEFILRLQTGCKRIKRKDFADFIMPIFQEVYEEAKRKDSSISDKVELFMTEDSTPNAFATGRKTVCITKGLFDAPEDEIKAVLGHEMGHLAHKDTDLVLIISVGNFIVTAFFICVRLFARFVTILCQIFGIMGGEIIIDLGAAISGFIVDILLVLFMKLWTKFGILLVMKSSRTNEYEADKFSADLGYGVSLCRFLDSFDSEGFDGLFASLMSSHPDNDQRIAKLQEQGVPYYLERA